MVANGRCNMPDLLLLLFFSTVSASWPFNIPSLWNSFLQISHKWSLLIIFEHLLQETISHHSIKTALCSVAETYHALLPIPLAHLCLWSLLQWTFLWTQIHFVRAVSCSKFLVFFSFYLRDVFTSVVSSSASIQAQRPKVWGVNILRIWSHL